MKPRWEEDGRGSKRQRRERVRREVRRERLSRVHEKGETSPKTLVFSDVLWLRRVDKNRLEKSEGGEIKKCTQLWREADLEIKMLKALHSRSTFGS